MGNIVNWQKLSPLLKKNKILILEDSADTLGATYKKKSTGHYADISITSFYGSHIINCAGNGGMVCFNDKKTYDRAKLLRGWGRSSAVFNESEGIKKRFNTKIDGVNYDGKYIFSDLGYNFLPSEISAAFALEQLKKLKANINIRKKNFAKLKNYFHKFSRFTKKTKYKIYNYR